ncbi:MAG: thermonuclease family protein [Alkalispirochaeta sp.]
MRPHRSSTVVVILLAILPAISGQSRLGTLQEIDVVRVIDGDTLVVSVHPLRNDHEGSEPPDHITVRLYGIDAPEVNQPGGRAATRFVRRWTASRDLLLLVHNADRYGRIIGEIVVQEPPDSPTLNEALVSGGLAWWYREYAREDRELARLEARARTAKRGLWSDTAPTPPWEWR